MWRRIWHFVVDLADGILGGLLYGHQGGLGVGSTWANAQNDAKLRRWAASGGRRSADAPEPSRQRTESAADFDSRMRRFRRETTSRD